MGKSARAEGQFEYVPVLWEKEEREERVVIVVVVVVDVVVVVVVVNAVAVSEQALKSRAVSSLRVLWLHLMDEFHWCYFQP